MNTLAQARTFYKRNERWMPIVFFVVGFVFDAVMLRRVDELSTLLQQVFYLIVVGVFIGIELIDSAKPPETVAPVKGIWGIWKYREALLHFMMGTLLNSYTIFFFKSASALTPFIFVILLIAVLMINEFHRFKKSRAQIHMAFWSLCLIAFFATLSPILLGQMGVGPFLFGVGISVLVFFGFYAFMRRRLAGHPGHPMILRNDVRLPFFSILAVFVLLYFFHAIPPVPLSVKYMGIFHDAKKEGDKFVLSYTRPLSRFWENGDETFLAREGDSVFCFVRIFAPTRFADSIQVRWLFKEKRGWVSADAIPMAITGGREEGYRGVTKKTAILPGKWRVQVETSDNREVGRIGFTIISDEGSGERHMHTLLQ